MSEEAAATTVFSLYADVPIAFRPRFDSATSALDTAWLVGEGGRIDCHLHKFSAAGATLRIDETIEPGSVWALQLANGQCIDGTVSWAEEGEAGFLFDAPTDVVGTLARNLALLPAERRRVPRVELPQSVGIRHGTDFEFARTRDLSQAGVGIETSLSLAEDDRVEVAFNGLSPLHGTVRWAQHGKAGIAFDTELSWQTLMPWLRQAQRTPGRPNGAQQAIHDGPRFTFAGDKTVIAMNTPARVREGARWWNVHVRNLTSLLVEFECATPLAKGAQLWLWLPGFAGWPLSVIEAEGPHYLAEFRLPLRSHELNLLTPGRMAAR